MGMTDEGAGLWEGRYRKIVGRKTSFSAVHGGVRVCWVDPWAGDGAELTSMLRGEDAAELNERVRWAKGQLGQRGGGSFLITEYGRVLVPVYDTQVASRNVWCAGTWTGPLVFDNPLTGAEFDLYNVDELKPGDKWNGPYIGLLHTMWPSDEIGMQRRGRNGWDWPHVGDVRIANALREIRGNGTNGWARVITGPGGVAITRDQELMAYFVGKIDLRYWFDADE